ncbi:MAG: PilZ domain-containing protein, partial [Methylococcales bacterium]|nr:PilZ domain-containing protein [Methylococcales bacterium]
WLKQIGRATKYEDNNDSLFNRLFYYYKRLYCVYLAYPIIFSDSDGIKHAFLSSDAINCIDFSNGQQTKARLSVNLFNDYISDQKLGSRLPLYVWYEDNAIHCLTNADVPKVSPKDIIAWLQTKQNWRVLLIRTRQIKVPESSQFDAIQKYANDKILDESIAFKIGFSKLTAVTSILDISSVFKNSDIDFSASKLHLVVPEKPANKNRKINYAMVEFKVKRNEARYAYATGIKLEIEQGIRHMGYSAQTVDISLSGLSIKLPYTEDTFGLNDQVRVDFTGWNDEVSKTNTFFAKKQKLNPIDYSIVKIDHNDPFSVLGLMRSKEIDSFNTIDFIKDKINNIKHEIAGVTRNEFDFYQSLYASVWLTNNISGLPFFLGSDADGVRIIQAIANTEENFKLRKPFLMDDNWSFLQQTASTFGLAMYELMADKSKPLKLLSCGVYCYLDEFNSDHSAGGWLTKTDFDFKTPTAKQQFIQEAIRHPKHFFYHCSLVSIKGYKDDILNNDVTEFISKAPHRVKEIHALCDALLAVGELNEITRLIEFMYKN